MSYEQSEDGDASGPPPQQREALERALQSAVDQAPLWAADPSPQPPESEVPAEPDAPAEPGVDPPEGPGGETSEEEAAKWNASINYWVESNGSNLLQDYFVTGSYGQLDIIVEHLVVPGDAWQRLRVHYGDFYLVKNEDAVVVFRPGGLIDTQGTGHYGGRLSVNFPKANFSIVTNAYAGNKINRHESFVEWKPHENLGMMYYRFADSSITPKSLLGPKVYIANKAYIYYGMPLNSDKRTLLWVGGNFSF